MVALIDEWGAVPSNNIVSPHPTHVSKVHKRHVGPLNDVHVNGCKRTMAEAYANGNALLCLEAQMNLCVVDGGSTSGPG